MPYLIKGTKMNLDELSSYLLRQHTNKLLEEIRDLLKLLIKIRDN